MAQISLANFQKLAPVTSPVISESPTESGRMPSTMRASGWLQQSWDQGLAAALRGPYNPVVLWDQSCSTASAPFLASEVCSPPLTFSANEDQDVIFPRISWRVKDNRHITPNIFWQLPPETSEMTLYNLGARLRTVYPLTHRKLQTLGTPGSRPDEGTALSGPGWLTECLLCSNYFSCSISNPHSNHVIMTIVITTTITILFTTKEKQVQTD